MSQENSTTEQLPPPPPVIQLPAAGESPIRQARRLSDKVPVSDVTLIIGYRDRQGARQEVIHDIVDSDHRIVMCSHNVLEKVQKVKDDQGNLMGFEPTGEYEVTIKIKYVRE